LELTTHNSELKWPASLPELFRADPNRSEPLKVFATVVGKKIRSHPGPSEPIWTYPSLKIFFVGRSQEKT
jgi:hypothetical protein